MRSFGQSRAFSTMGNEWRFNLQSFSSSLFEGCGRRALRVPAENRIKNRGRGRFWLWLRQTMIRTAAVRIAAQFLNIVLFAIASPAQDAQNPSAAVSRGKQIYLYGTGCNGVAIEALAGEGSVIVPAAVLRCVNCHGPDGRGKPEGGVYPSNIRWTELSKPYAIAAGSGRERPPYNESLVIRDYDGHRFGRNTAEHGNAEIRA